MKKYLIVALAIFAVITFFAFNKKEKSPAKPKTFYVWFDVKPNPASQTALLNSEVTYNSGLGAAPLNNPSGCTSVGPYNCTVGFNQNQVTGTSLKPGLQTIQVAYYKRNTP